jgi:translation initiation factor 1
LCVCGAMAKEAAKIKISTSKRAFGKWVTVVEGIEKDANPKELASRLKTKLACGGTFKENKIELQGEHAEKVKKLLVGWGFAETQIEME